MTVCGSSWDSSDAQVVCNQMNCGKSHKVTYTDAYGRGTGNFLLGQFGCSGSELSLSQCIQSGGDTCNVTSIAGVICTGNRNHFTFLFIAFT